jgi:hypothetical protein
MASKAGLLGGAVYHHHQLLLKIALGEVVERAQLHGLHAIGNGAKGGEQDHFGIGGGSFVAGQQVHAVAIGQLHVAEYQQHLVGVLLEQLQAAGGVGSLQHGVAFQL